MTPQQNNNNRAGGRRFPRRNLKTNMFSAVSSQGEPAANGTVPREQSALPMQQRTMPIINNHPQQQGVPGAQHHNGGQLRQRRN